MSDSCFFQIFRTGRHTASNGHALFFGEGELAMTAAHYSPANSAPLCLGHPQDNQPCYGEVTQLIAKKGGLFAVARVDDALVNAVRAGRYKHVSASFHAPRAPMNPNPGVWTLRHVGFLGSMPPAVKGMASLSFAEQGGGVAFAEATPLERVFETRAFSKSASLEERAWSIAAAAQNFRSICPALSFIESIEIASGICRIEINQ